MINSAVPCGERYDIEKCGEAQVGFWLKKDDYSLFHAENFARASKNGFVNFCKGSGTVCWCAI